MSKKDDSDLMSREQDEQLEQLEERLTALYANAANEINSKLTDFLNAYKKQDEKKQAEVEAGTLSPEEYSTWRRTQMLNNTRYTAAVESMTNTLVNTDAAAMAAVNGQMPRVVAQSYDFVSALGSISAEKQGVQKATFQIYNARTIQELEKKNPDLFPKPRVNIDEDKKWNKDRIQREMTQGILQGEPIGKIADCGRNPSTNAAPAVRNARTAFTSAENLGRSEAADDLKAQGIPVEEVWSATYDKRTRDSHLLLDGTTRDASGFFGVGIIATPLRFPGDPDGDPEEVYNCRCRLNIQLEGIDHSKDDDLYEKFMKENHPDDWENLQENEPYQARQAEAAETKERQAELREQQALTLPPAESLLPPEENNSGYTGPVQGEDISGTWERRPDQYDFEINDIINAQGFDGLPKIATPEEFDKAVQESNFIAQRTYSAADQETVDAYRDQLYHGDWYVDCSTGGAQYGQGMYVAADYNGELTDGIREEMDHYRELGDSRFGGRMTDEERVEAAKEMLPENITNNGTAMEYLKALQSGNLSEQAKYYSMLDRETERAVSRALNETPINKKAANHTETMTLTPDAKIIKYDDIRKEHKEYEKTETKKIINEVMEGIKGRASAMKAVAELTLTGDGSKRNKQFIKEYRSMLSDAEKRQMNKVMKEIEKKQKEKVIKDLGSFAASKGYDAINAEGHGQSGSYTVILNRTKVIIKGGTK